MKPDYSPVRRWSLALLTVLFAFAFASAAHAQLTFGSTTYSGTGTSIAKGDINNDGFVDLFVVDEFNLQGRIYINNGSGGLIGPTFPNGPFFPRTGGLADLNGDGNLDILGPDGSRVWIEFGNGAGGFSPQININTGGDQLAAAADCNGDGITDILTAGGASGNPQNIHCLPGNGNGTFGAAISSAGTAHNSRSAKAADIDNDGDLDVVSIPGPLGDFFRIFLNNGSGTFSFASDVSIVPGVIARRIAVGDVNGDGMADVITGTSPGNPSTAQVRVYLATGGGNMSFFGSLTVGVSVWGIDTHDMDLDGDLDVLLGTSGGSGNAAKVLINDGTGVLSNGSSNALSHFPEALIGGLFNAMRRLISSASAAVSAEILPSA